MPGGYSAAGTTSVRQGIPSGGRLHQLAELWRQLPLRDLRAELTDLKGPTLPGIALAGHFPPITHPSLVVSVGTFAFVPLVSTRINLVCRLDILFLRREEPGRLITEGGDIDNRLKTLLDALRIPKSGSEVMQLQGPQPDEEPFYCLLEDDSLVTHISVTTDRLLTQPQDPSHVSLILHVTLKATRGTFTNMAFSG